MTSKEKNYIFLNDLTGNLNNYVGEEYVINKAFNFMPIFDDFDLDLFEIDF